MSTREEEVSIWGNGTIPASRPQEEALESPELSMGTSSGPVSHPKAGTGLSPGAALPLPTASCLALFRLCLQSQKRSQSGQISKEAPGKVS